MLIHSLKQSKTLTTGKLILQAIFWTQNMESVASKQAHDLSVQQGNVLSVEQSKLLNVQQGEFE